MSLNALEKNQQGFLMPLAIFIIVVMGTFALVISRNTIQSSTSAVQEAISTQTFYAAESGAQLGMQKLFFPDASSRQLVDSSCAGLLTTPLVKTYSKTGVDVPGLNSCTITVTCSCTFQDESSCSPITASNYTSTAATNRLTSFYKISSTATCGAGNLRSVRTIEAGSFLTQE